MQANEHKAPVRLQLLHEGRTKRFYATEDPELLIVEYRDDAAGRGAVNNRVTEVLLHLLEQEGIPTYLVRPLSDRESLVRRTDKIPLKVIVRNVVAGSLVTRIGRPEGTPLKSAILEYYYKDDTLGDPMINRYHAFELEVCTPQELAAIDRCAFRVNEILSARLSQLGIRLIDFKLEFGRLSDGTVVLADEVSPETCRLWDARTGERLDKERLRRESGAGVYREILRRLVGDPAKGNL